MNSGKDSMTPRERWEAVLKREAPDRVPMDWWGTAEAARNLMAHMGCDWAEVARRLHIDQPLMVGGRYVGPPPPEGEDVFGLRRKAVDYGTGTYSEVANAPLAGYVSVEEIEANYTWPSPDWWDYSHLPETIKGHESRPTRGGGSEPFLLYCQLRGIEQAFMDLVLAPDIVEYCLDKLFGLAYENTRRVYEAIPGRVLITYVAEDLGSQQSLLMSKEHIRRFLLPRMKRMMDLAHSAGAYVFTHSDGAVREIVEDLIGIGMDVLNPIQWRLPGMAREGLKADFGDRIFFHGAVDNQSTLPFGSVADVKQEVADNLRILGAGGGYILAPCHNIQAVTPPENMVALYEAGYELGAGCWRR